MTALHSSLVSSVAQLDTLSAEVESHQAQWAALLAQKAEVEALERNVRSLVRDLQREKVELESMVEEGREIVKSIDKAGESESMNEVANQTQRVFLYSWPMPTH